MFEIKSAFVLQPDYERMSQFPRPTVATLENNGGGSIVYRLYCTSRFPHFSVLSEIRFSHLSPSFLGSGPDRGRCPVEHRGEIPFVRPYIPPLGWLRLSRGWLKPPPGWTDGRMDGWADGWTDGISPLCSTGHCPLLGPLPCLHLALAPQLMAGQGYR